MIDIGHKLCDSSLRLCVIDMDHMFCTVGICIYYVVDSGNMLHAVDSGHRLCMVDSGHRIHVVDC